MNANASETIRPFVANRFVVEPKHKLVYCPIEKNSCTYFKKLLLENSEFAEEYRVSDLDPHNFLKQTGVLKFQDLSPISDPEYLRFVVFRHPIDRIVSAYMNKFVRNRRYPNALAATQEYRERNGMAYSPDELLTFREFAEFIKDKPPKDLDVHWRPQHTFVRKELSWLDCRVAIERIPEFAEMLSNRYGWKIDTAKTANQNRYGSYPMSEGLCDASPSKLRQLESVPDVNSLVTDEISAMLAAPYERDFKLYEKSLTQPLP